MRIHAVRNTSKRWSMASFHTATVSGVACRSCGEDQTTAWSETTGYAQQPAQGPCLRIHAVRNTPKRWSMASFHTATVSSVACRSCGEDQTTAWSETAGYAQQPAQGPYLPFHAVRNTPKRSTMASFHTATVSGVTCRSCGEDQTTPWSETAGSAQQ